MDKTLFLQTNIDELNKSVNNKIVLCTYNKSCILPMSICHTAIINKIIEYWYNFFVVLGNGPALLEIPHLQMAKATDCDCKTKIGEKW